MPMKQLEHELNRELSKEEVQIANKFMKKCSISLVRKKCKSKQHLDFLPPQLEWP
jgi:hypothetical protein